MDEGARGTDDRRERAAAALARGDPLTALNTVGSDDSGHGHALRGIALAQLQELDVAARELALARDAFAHQPLFRARAAAALAEVAAARRELGTALEDLGAAADELERLGDPRNGAWARLVRARLLLLTGSLEEARREIARAASLVAGDPVVEAARGLATAIASMRALAPEDALRCIAEALEVLGRDGHPLLAAELDSHRSALGRSLARATARDARIDLALPALAVLFRGGSVAPELPLAGARRWFVVDGIARRALFCGEDAADLSTREVLFALLWELAARWPEPVETDELVERVFEGPRGEESHRNRVKVEIGRLRRELPPPARIQALGGAWRLEVGSAVPVVRLELVNDASTLSALLSDGQAWAVRDLALAIGSSPRTVQRALAGLVERGLVEPEGQARARRWRAPGAAGGIASQMFLLGLLDPAHPPAAEPARGPNHPNEEETP